MTPQIHQMCKQHIWVTLQYRHANLASWWWLYSTRITVMPRICHRKIFGPIIWHSCLWCVPNGIRFLWIKHLLSGPERPYWRRYWMRIWSCYLLIISRYERVVCCPIHHSRIGQLALIIIVQNRSSIIVHIHTICQERWHRRSNAETSHVIEHLQSLSKLLLQMEDFARMCCALLYDCLTRWRTVCCLQRVVAHCDSWNGWCCKEVRWYWSLHIWADVLLTLGN